MENKAHFGSLTARMQAGRHEESADAAEHPGQDGYLH